jgi:serine protease Do
LRKGDVIVSVNGRDVEDPETFHYRTTALAIGSTAEFGIIREGQKATLHVDMIAPPEDPPRHETLVGGRNPVAGAKIANLSPAVVEELGLPGAERGVVVTFIKEGTVAARIGLQVGDILVSVNGGKIANVDEALTLLKKAEGGWRLTVRRDGNDVTMMIGG